MLVIRPIQPEDLDQLVELAGMTSFGLTSLPKDRELLRRRIRTSQRAFEDMPSKPGAELYLFVLEDTDSGVLAGTCGIVAKTGGFEPFYAYQLETEHLESAMLGVSKEVATLHLVAEHNGPTEIGSLFLRPSHRRGGIGRLLSLSRFLFMAEHPDSFEDIVIAEMRGLIDERGHSEFWDALGRKFFDIDFPDADYLSTVDKRFIAELMPTHPIYVMLLPAVAQAAIGQVHERTRPALRMLESEGFTDSDMVDIFEAGRIVSCPRERIRVVRQSVLATVDAVTEAETQDCAHVIANTQAAFRSCMGAVTVVHPGAVRISAATARALGVAAGDTIRYANLRPAAEAD